MKLLMRDSVKYEAGRLEGLQEGERKGTLSEKFATAKRMLSSGFKIPEILKLTELSLEDLNSLLQKA